MTTGSSRKWVMAYGRRVLAGLALLAAVTGTLAACDGEDSDGYTPPPATIIRAADTATPTATPTPTLPTKELSPTPSPQAGTVSPTEGYPAPAITPSQPGTPEAYPAK